VRNFFFIKIDGNLSISLRAYEEEHLQKYNCIQLLANSQGIFAIESLVQLINEEICKDYSYYDNQQNRQLNLNKLVRFLLTVSKSNINFTYLNDAKKILQEFFSIVLELTFMYVKRQKSINNIIIIRETMDYFKSIRTKSNEKILIKSSDLLKRVKKVNQIMKSQTFCFKRNILINNNTSKDFTKDTKSLILKTRQSLEFNHLGSSIGLKHKQEEIDTSKSEIENVKKKKEIKRSSKFFFMSKPEIINTLNNELIKQEVKKVQIEIAEDEATDSFSNLNI